ncbi:MAG: efflux RND transporter periplasmic adaptor subunit [Thermoguttaceae bacterium]|jgi:RND family efflux transporter MFP subunit|nr:efflux RND transporter periplasmic adaptor subunit [Thermoguttaceae bacterium]
MKFTSFLAVGITALLIGAGVSYYTISNQTNAKMTDKAFLEKQLKSLSSGDKKDTTRRLPIVRVAPAQMSDISDEQIFDGRLVEIQKVVLASEVSGLINEMTVEVGDKVQAKKTLIVGVDATWLNIALIQAQRQKEFDRVNMTLQKAELNRLERLRERQAGVVTDSELEKQTALAEESVAKYKLSEAMENEIQEKLNRTKIYAPFNGAIIRKLAELGAYVSPGTPLVEIVSDGQADALFHINEKFIQRIHIGDPLPIYVPAVDKTVNGEIVSIVPYGSTAARSFPVRIRIDDQDGLLKIGMSVQCTLETTEKAQRLTVPRDAVLQKPGENTVWVVQKESDGSLRVTPVPVYIHAKANAVLAVRPATEAGEKTLVPGALTIIEGAERLMPGQEVELKEVNPELLKDLPTAGGMQSFTHEKE